MTICHRKELLSRIFGYILCGYEHYWDVICVFMHKNSPLEPMERTLSKARSPISLPPSGFRSENSKFFRPANRIPAVAYVELLVDVVQVGFDGFR